MGKYVMVKVDIPIEQGGELHRRLESVARECGKTTEAVIAFMVQMGVYGHIEGNLSLYERGAKE